MGFLYIWRTFSLGASPLELLTYLVYGFGWIGLYSCSTIYHASRHLGRKAHLRMLDHCAIFMVIAASYGPFVMTAVNTRQGYMIWAVSWLITLGGCLFKYYSKYRYHAQSTWLYVIQGWMICFSLPTMLRHMSTAAFLWLLLAALSLTGGIFFYLRDDVKYNHGVWHLCVMLGSVGFYRSIIDLLAS